MVVYVEYFFILNNNHLHLIKSLRISYVQKNYDFTLFNLSLSRAIR